MKILYMDEIVRVKMKKNEKNVFCNSKKHNLFSIIIYLFFWFFISKMVYKT